MANCEGLRFLFHGDDRRPRRLQTQQKLLGEAQYIETRVYATVNSAWRTRGNNSDMVHIINKNIATTLKKLTHVVQL